MKQFIMLVLCMLLISACDSGGGAPEQNNATGSDESGSALAVDTASDEDTVMEVSGAVSFNTGNVRAYWIQMETTTYPIHVIEIDGREGYITRLAYSGDLQVGTYDINNALDTEYTQEGIFTAGLLYLYSPEESKQYRNSPSGTVSVQFGDQRIIGTFNFTSSNASGETVTVKGHFNAPISDGVAE